MKYLVVFILLSLSLQAQIKATTEAGDKVILHTDGTWGFDVAKKYDCSIITKEGIKSTSPMIGIHLNPAVGIQLIEQDGKISFMSGQDEAFCIDETATSFIYLDGGGVIILENQYENCDGITFNILSELNITKLKTGVVSFAVNTKTKGLVMCDFNTEQKAQFSKSLECLTKK